MITYKVIARKSPTSGEVKYYPQRCGTDRISFEQLCERVAHATTATEADAAAVITETVEQVKLCLLDAHSVEVGKMGTIYTTLSTIGQAVEEDVTADDILAVNLRMRFKPKFKAYLQKSAGNVKFKKLGEDA